MTNKVDAEPRALGDFKDQKFRFVIGAPPDYVYFTGVIADDSGHPNAAGAQQWTLKITQCRPLAPPRSPNPHR